MKGKQHPKASKNTWTHKSDTQPSSAAADVGQHITSLTLFFFSRPPMTLSMACSKCDMLTTVSLARAATSAASLHTLAISAPLNPGVRAAKRSA